MNTNERILEELIAIRKLMTIFAQDKLDEFQASIKSKYLTTSQRQQMYDLFDGATSLKDIGAAVGTSSEAVRQFAVALEKAGLVEYVLDGKTKFPKRVF